MLKATLKSLLVATLAVVVTAIPAHADKGPAGDNPEDNYLYVMNGAGIVHRSDSDSVTAGYAVCDNIARAVMPRSMMNEVAVLAPKLSAKQAETVVDSAVVWLCPQYTLWYTANR